MKLTYHSVSTVRRGLATVEFALATQHVKDFLYGGF